MTSVPYMPFFCGDYLKDTTGLSLEENGAYLKILMITWAQGGKPLPDDDARMANHLSITRDRWVKRLKPVLAPFFDLSGGTWRNERLEREWLRTQAKIAARKEAGAKGGRTRRNGPENDPNSPEGSHCNTAQNGDANSRKNNETTQAKASHLLKQNGSTHTHTSSYEEENKGGAVCVTSASPPAHTRTHEAPPRSAEIIPIRPAVWTMPDDWPLPDDWREWALSLGHWDPDGAAEKFKTTWLARRDRGEAGAANSDAVWRRYFEGWINGDLKHGAGHGQQHRGAKAGRGSFISRTALGLPT